ncbi:type III toxin-antitoxin system ToxN/AbiQ family toxin [Companilactobacillus sp. FL22-1]|uniref:type III toxin-antitoxin system ToxN/AbiQ family toxin n=1 Tax=Companilactobacillus sp. FL22-1 TaxID=3373892 RepID=UPI0037541338
MNKKYFIPLSGYSPEKEAMLCRHAEPVFPIYEDVDRPPLSFLRMAYMIPVPDHIYHYVIPDGKDKKTWLMYNKMNYINKVANKELLMTKVSDVYTQWMSGDNKLRRTCVDFTKMEEAYNNWLMEHKK